MILAIPNHYSMPYRLAYLIFKLFGKRQFPDEEKIYDFNEEIKDIKNLKMIERKIVSK
jgi:hypothetical protein